MSDELVTLATFGTPIEASLVQNQLEAEGIRVFLADDAVVGMAWHLGGAVGGVKIQVADRDIQRALAVLESSDRTPIAEDAWRTYDTDGSSDSDDDDVDHQPPDALTDERVARAYRAAGLGWIIWPLQFYSLWLLMDVVIDGAPMSDANRRRMLTTLVLDLPVIVLFVVLLWVTISGWAVS